MRLNDEKLQWIYNRAAQMQKVATALDFLKDIRADTLNYEYRKAASNLENLAFSLMMVSLGEHIPSRLWGVNDSCALYSLLDDARDELEIRDDM